MDNSPVGKKVNTLKGYLLFLRKYLGCLKIKNILTFGIIYTGTTFYVIPISTDFSAVFEP